MDLPKVVSAEEWESANKRIISKEKELMRQSDALAAERRRQPTMRVENEYEFVGPNGNATLLDLFEGRPQLFVYNFMFGPNQEVGCDGCSPECPVRHAPGIGSPRSRTIEYARRASGDEPARAGVAQW